MRSYPATVQDLSQFRNGELGVGIVDRAQNTQTLVNVIHRANSDTDLHVLGCGNLLSFSLLSMAGAMLFDGLEWCRVCASENFHLHHFQHREVFESYDPKDFYSVADILLSYNPDYEVYTSVHNLVKISNFYITFTQTYFLRKCPGFD